GRKGSPRAAAWNLQNSLRVGFLQRVLRSRVQLGREGGSILVTVPGAQIQGTGYDKPLALTLQERIAGVGDLNL
ncbi:MAG: hypothetical protein GWN58_19645, partial [Anaerolineae bacterium]|nr:hypothetical protein [Anaerolineae bacterium]